FLSPSWARMAARPSWATLMPNACAPATANPTTSSAAPSTCARGRGSACGSRAARSARTAQPPRSAKPTRQASASMPVGRPPAANATAFQLGGRAPRRLAQRLHLLAQGRDGLAQLALEHGGRARRQLAGGAFHCLAQRGIELFHLTFERSLERLAEALLFAQQ